MELREYVEIIRRRWPIVAAMTLLALVTSTAFAARGPRAFEATTRIAVSVGAPQLPADAAPYQYFRDYYAWLSSEYLADDLSQIFTSDAFADDIKAELNEDVDRSAIRDVVRTRKTHRILEVSAQAPSPERARRIIAALSTVVQAKGGKYLAQLAEPTAQITVIDEPSVKSATTTGNQLADIGLRTLLGFLAGVFLAFVVDFLDSTLRSPRLVQQALGLPILGEIPSES